MTTPCLGRFFFIPKLQLGIKRHSAFAFVVNPPYGFAEYSFRPSMAFTLRAASLCKIPFLQFCDYFSLGKQRKVTRQQAKQKLLNK